MAVCLRDIISPLDRTYCIASKRELIQTVASAREAIMDMDIFAGANFYFLLAGQTNHGC